MFSKTGADAYKKDITNTVKLCKSIGDPQSKFLSIHIAGTNGKGSVSHMLAAIFQQAGYKTGLYTSPHLKDFRERIKLNGRMVPEEFVISFVEKTKAVTNEIEPSFFELTVAMAFEYFSEEQVDIAIIETGLGGRLDSTNIITPVLSVITNIGYDHMNILGDTLEQIASEKAGIIKKDTPVVIGESIPETRQIFISEAAKKNASLTFAEEQFDITNTQPADDRLEIILTDCNDSIKTYITDLCGYYQQKNIRTVITAVNELKKQGYNIEDSHVSIALSKVQKLTGLHGRWEIIDHHPRVVLDVAHNEDGIKQLNEQLSISNYQDLHIVFGMVKDKEVDKVLSLLPKNAKYYFTKAHIPRALSQSELMLKAAAYDLQGTSYDEVNEALNTARTSASKDDMILVTGSFFVVGEVDNPNFAH